MRPVGRVLTPGRVLIELSLTCCPVEAASCVEIERSRTDSRVLAAGCIILERATAFGLAFPTAP